MLSAEKNMQERLILPFTRRSRRGLTSSPPMVGKVDRSSAAVGAVGRRPSGGSVAHVVSLSGFRTAIPSDPANPM